MPTTVALADRNFVIDEKLPLIRKSPTGRCTVTNDAMAVPVGESIAPAARFHCDFRGLDKPATYSA
jgi:hypothetical protein